MKVKNGEKLIRAGSGLGDSLYLQVIVRQFVNSGVKLRVASNYPDVFKQLPVEVIPFTRNGVNILAHYSMRRDFRDTTQFEDMCLQAGLGKQIEYKSDWNIENTCLIDELKAHNKPIALIQMARQPMDRADGFGRDILPDCNKIQTIINHIKDRYLIVQIGSGKSLFQFENIDVDLVDKTKISDLLDLGKACDFMLGYCSFMIPLAELFNKKALFVWSEKNIKSNHSVIRTITPKKILHKKDTCHFVVDSDFDEDIKIKVNDFLR